MLAGLAVFTVLGLLVALGIRSAQQAAFIAAAFLGAV